METIINAVDLFCGAGGTSTGLINAAAKLGYKLNLLAINHWDVAIATHSVNYPWASHLCENLDNVNPRNVVPSGHLNLLVASPECTHHSNARGGRPMSDQSRASAFHILRWAEALYIDNIIIENVKEFMNWGPLDKEGKPVQKLKGQTFLAFINALKSLGYNVDYRVLNSANFGGATTRERLFIMASRDKPVCWPEITHSKDDNFGFLAKTRRWRAAKDIIDWDVKGESIYKRKKPLAPNTMRRIMKGLEKFGGASFVIGQQSKSAPRNINFPIPTIAGKGAIALVEPFIVKMYGTSNAASIHQPLPTVTAKSNHLYLCEPFIVALNHGKDDSRSYSVDRPMPTITSVDAWGLAQPFLVNYYGNGQPLSLDDPLATITGRDRFGLVVPQSDGREAVVDILFRMLTPGELAAAMSFPKDYQFTGTREKQVKQIGNAVECRTAEALCMVALQGSAA